MKKSVTLIITFFTMIFIMISGVHAESKINTSIDANHKQLKAGEEVEITLKFNDYNNIKKGIKCLKRYIKMLLYR